MRSAGVLLVMIAALWLPPSGGGPLQGASTVQNGSTVAGWAAVDRRYREQVRAAGIVGSSLVLVRDGAVAAIAAEGYQDLDANRPVDLDTIYP
jgi:CubicO group peptidase (beta-lactamase class C family)